MAWDGPVLDNHLHLNAATGAGLDAVADFARAGGTDMLIVNRPAWNFTDEVRDPTDFEPGFRETIRLCGDASERLAGRAWPVLGVHPALISRLVDTEQWTPADAADLMCKGLDQALETARENGGVAIKSGRPHYAVDEDVWTASNRVLQHALDLAAGHDVAVQLHTEPGNDFSDIAAWAETAGLAPERVVKHYAAGPITGPLPSVIARKDGLRAAATSGDPFLMETDFLDDPDRPGAVLGPKTVPRRTTWLVETVDPAAARTAHVTAPKRVYGIETTPPDSG